MNKGNRWWRAVYAQLAVLSIFLAGTAGAQNPPFYDLNSTHWAYESVRELADLGILTGYPDGRFDGTRATTRYEVAVVAARLLEYVQANGGSSRAGETEPLAARMQALETALSGATSLEYTRSLEARLVVLEQALEIPPQTSTAQQTVQQEVTLPEVQTSDAQATSPATTPAAPGSAVNLPGVSAEIRFSSRPDYPFFVGISPGVVSTAGDVYLGVQAGYDALLGPVGPAARLTFNGGNRELRLSVDALAKADLLFDTLKLYGGLGVGTTVRPDGGSVLLEAPFGGEYFITERVSLFLQLTTSYGFAPINNVDAELTTGINLRF